MSNTQKQDKKFFDEISDAIIITDLNYNIIAWNDAAERIYGWKAQEIIGKNIMDTIRIEYINQDPRDVIKEFENENNWSGEVIQYTKNGRKIQVRSSVSLIKDVNGTPKEIIAINQDLTETRKIEKRLKISEKKYQLIVENAQEGIWMIDENGYTNFVNDRMAEMLDYSRDEMMGKHLYDFSDEEYTKIAKKNIQRRKKGIKEQHEFQFVKKNDEKIYTNLNASPIFTEEGKYIGSVALISDITEKKEAERKLKESEEKFRKISEQSLIGLQIIQNGKLVYLNRTAADFTGFTPEEIKSMDFKNIVNNIHPEDIKSVRNRFKERLNNPNKIKDPFQFRVIHKDGTIRWIESLNKSIKYKGNDADLIFLVDITDKKKAETSLKKSEVKYREAYDKANFYKDLFIHDMNNILQVISSSTELIQKFFKNQKEEEIKGFTDMIQRQINRGTELILNIHKLSVLEEKDIEIESVDAIKILMKVTDYVKKAYSKQNVNIHIKTPFNNYNIPANELLEEVYQNLLINSIKYNDNEKKEIIIRISEEKEEDNKFLKLEFIDNGRGIEDERKDIIFQKGKKTEKGSKGLGFGLSLVQLIIKKFNGKIWAEDRIKGNYQAGSKFIILLPV